MTMQTAAAPHPNQSIIFVRRQSVVGAGPELAQLLDSVRPGFNHFGHEPGHAAFDAFYDLGARRFPPLGPPIDALRLAQAAQLAIAGVEALVGFRLPERRHAGVAHDHYPGRVVIDWHILFVAPHLRLDEEGAGFDRVFGAVAMAWRLHRDAVDAAHRADRKNAISAERLAAQPAAREAESLGHIARVDDAESALRPIGARRQMTRAIGGRPTAETPGRQPPAS